MKKEEKQFAKDLRIVDKEKKKKSNISWTIRITVAAFFISLLFSFASESLMPKVPLLVGIFIVIIFIFLGILFDMIGVAVTSADEKPFHSMSAKKIRGADVAVSFKKNASKVSSFCNDVIGDICGVISGSAGVYIASNLSTMFGWNVFVCSLCITALIAAFTIGGKAMGKGMAIGQSTTILYEFSKFISHFYHPKNK